MKEFWIQKKETFQRVYQIKADTLEEAKLHLLEQRNAMDVPEECIDSSTKTAEVDYAQYIDSDHQCCLWYGSEVAVVKYGEFTFRICANGDVCFEGKFNNGEGVRLEDKGNHGTFYNVLHNLIPDDQFLANYQYSHPNAFVNTNWFEVFVIDGSGKEFTESFVLDSTYVAHAIEEVIENANDYINRLLNNPSDPNKKEPTAARYMVVQKDKTMLLAWSQSKYADMHNIGPLYTGEVFDSKEAAKAVAKPLDYEVLELQKAVFEDIKKQAEAGKSADEKRGQNYTQNVFDHIMKDLALLQKEG